MSDSLGLHSAAARSNTGLVKYALSNGAAIDSRIQGVQAIHAAASGGSEEVVRMLLEHGADVNAPRLSRKHEKGHGGALQALGTTGSTPLHFAAANGHLGVVSLLLNAGGRADAREKHGQTPQDIARAHGHIAVADLLRQAEIGQKDVPQELIGPAQPVAAIKRGLHKATSNPSLSGVAPSHSWMRPKSSSSADRTLRGSAGLPASMSVLSVDASGSKRRPSMTSVMGKALGLSKAHEEPEASTSRPRPAPLDLTPAEYREVGVQRSLSSDQRRRQNVSDESPRPKRSPRLSNSLYSPPRTAPPGQMTFLQHRPRHSSNLSRSSSVRANLDEIRSRPTEDGVIEDDEDESEAQHEEETPRRPQYTSQGSSQWSSTSRTHSGTDESTDRFPGPDELVAALASARRARGDSIGSYASESSRFGPPSSSYFGPVSPLAGSSSRSSRSGSDPPRALFVPGSFGSSSVISHTTAPTSIADERAITPSMAHSMVVKMQEDILHPRAPGEMRPSLSEQISAYGAALQMEREIQRRETGSSYIYEKLDKDGTRTLVGRSDQKDAAGDAKPTRAFQQGSLDRRRPSVPRLRQEIDGAPSIHIPSAVEPQFALQSGVNKVYDARSASTARLMVPVTSRRSHDSNSSGRRSPSSTWSGGDKPRKDSIPSMTSPLAVTKTITPTTQAEYEANKSSKNSRFRKAMSALTGHSVR